MSPLRVPKEISLSDIHGKNASWSAGMYRRVIIPTSSVKTVRDLLDTDKPFEKGIEPGSRNYLRRSSHYLIRTKALQEYSHLIYPKGDAIVPINPRSFVDFHLNHDDILMSKDSNVGECAIVDGNFNTNHTFSGGVVRLHTRIDRYYLFAFLKHPLFKDQLLAKVPRGATLVHAKDLWLDCLIPFPIQQDAPKVIRYVGALMQTTVEKESTIRARNRAVDNAIHAELAQRQVSSDQFEYSPPAFSEIRDWGRLDASIYSIAFKRILFFITNYGRGCTTYAGLGFKVYRGQNLQVSCIGKSTYSDRPKPNFYRLVAPTDISEYRTVREFRYLGNSKQLSVLRKGDVVFGAEGFCKGRVVVLIDDVENTITNIHGVVFHPTDGDTNKGIFFGCFLGYLRKCGIVDAIGAGGSGGSLSISYFDRVPFPKFSSQKREDIARLYSNPTAVPSRPITLDTFVQWHRKWNDSLGIWELDREMKALQSTLRSVQQKIIDGETVVVPLE